MSPPEFHSQKLKNKEKIIGTNVNTKKPIKFGRMKEYAISVFLLPSELRFVI